MFPTPDSPFADGRDLPAGSRWRDGRSGKVVVILRRRGEKVWVRFEDETDDEKFRCAVEDFGITGWYTRVS